MNPVKNFKPQETVQNQSQSQNNKPNQTRTFWDTGKAETPNTGSNSGESQNQNSNPGTIDLRGII